jgi:hypothetical protein
MSRRRTPQLSAFEIQALEDLTCYIVRSEQIAAVLRHMEPNTQRRAAVQESVMNTWKNRSPAIANGISKSNARLRASSLQEFHAIVNGKLTSLPE